MRPHFRILSTAGLISVPVAAVAAAWFVAGVGFASEAAAAELPPFRTDAQGPFTADEQKKLKNKKTAHEVLQWFQLEAGRFPPAGSEHAISGELIRVDHLERRFHLRVDRNDSQDRGVWDLPVDAFLLPYATIHYHGSPAALEDIPLGTHLHGLFYMRAPDDLTPPPDANNNRKTPEIDFRRCYALEDDFTRNRRRSETWKIESVDLSTKKLTALLEREGSPQGKPQLFDLLSSTVVYEGRGFGTLESLKPGGTALLNLTWGTLYGPGRITEIYLDETSRALAAGRQLERHRNHVRERGLPGWIDSVNDKEETVTITFFGNVDPKLFDELTLLPPPPPPGTPAAANAPPADGKPPLPKGGLAVARECLMTYDPVNDRKGATILEVKKVPAERGSGGVQMTVKADMMLEGFRPKRIVRFYPPTWKVTALPREEQFFGRE
jgi:hypothetical protein